jgi:hypothetical protein
MTAFALVVQKGIYTTLINNVPLMAAVVRVSDDVPQPSDAGDAANFPYVTIGEDVFTDISTDTELMSQVSITIHVWSRQAGRFETKTIQSLIYDALNRADITESGYKFININQTQSESRLDSDGHTRHGIQTYNLLIEEL